MASYTRRSTFGDGELITAALFNNEYNQLVDAFSNTTGHKHDGTVGEGPVIGIIGDAGVVTPFNKILVDSTNDHIEFWIDVSGTSTQQFYIADGAIVPVTDNDVDLGTSSLQFKDLYINGTANIDSLVADTADINGGTIDGVTIGASSAGAITGTTITATSFVIGSANITETELEILDGATLTTTELNYVDGVTSSIQTQINTKAPLASPSLTGIPTAPTAASNTNTTQVATTAYVQTEITDLIDAAPGTLDTLNELAAAINDDANYNSTLTTALATKLPLAGGTMTGNVTYSDNVKAQFGTSQDLQIYHDGTTNVIKSTTSNIELKVNGGGNFKVGDEFNNFMFVVNDNSDVQLYHGTTPSLKLATTSTGIDVTGVITTDGLTTSADINFGDNDKAVFGAGGDLEIYHDGSHSYVRNTVTGNLYIRNLSDDKDIILQSDDGAGGLANYVQVDGSNGEVRLSHYGSEKFNTTSTGIDVTGTVVSDGLTVEGDAKINDTDATPLVIQRNGGTDANTSIHYEQNTYNTYVGTGNSGTFVVGNSADLGSSRRFAIEQNNDISFYEDTGSTAKLFWDASAESLGIGTTSPSRTLHIKDSVAGIRLEDSDGTSYGEIIYNEGSNGLLIRSDENNADSGSNIIFEVDGGEKARIDSSGNVLVGKTSASSASIGFQAGQNGFTAITRASAQPLVLNRTTNDGIIVEFKKDSTQVGSIGAYNSATAILSGSAGSYSGLYLNTNKIEPVGNNFGSEIRANNTIDIGSSTYKFKDIYLSGTANFGSLSDGTITITGFVDEDNMATNSATLVPTQQSVKAYVDSQVSSAGGNGISFEDNEKAQFGDGNDLQIYHDGSNSYVQDAGDGELRLNSDNGVRIRKHDNETLALFSVDGSASLWYDNAQKISTTSTGIDVTGTVTSDGLTVSDSQSSGVTAQIQNSNPTQTGGTRLDFLYSGSTVTGRIQNRFNGGDFQTDWYTGNDGLEIFTDLAKTEKRLAIASNGDISFYDDTGTSQNLKWDASADSLNFVDNAKAQFGASNDLQIYHDGSHSYIEDAGTGDLIVKGASIEITTGAGNKYFRGAANIARLYHTNNEKLATTSSGVNVTGTVTSDGLTVDGTSSALVASIENDSTDAGSGGLKVNTASTSASTIPFYVRSNNLNRFRVSGNGDISFYDDTGSSQNMVWDASADSLNFVDNAKAQFGAGNDLQIYHDGTHSHIINATGDLTINSQGDDLILKASDDFLLQVQETDIAIQAVGDGKVGLRYNNAEKLATTSTGIDVTGTAAADNLHINHTSGQLKISRNGSSNNGIYWDRLGTQDAAIHVASNEQLNIDNNFGNPINLRIGADGSETTYLSVNTTGIDVTGNNLDHTALSPQYNMIESDITGNNTQFLQVGGDLRIRTIDDSKANPVERLRIDHASGDISFYDDTGSTQGLFWDASAEQLLLGITATAAGGSLVAKTDSNGYGIAIEENSGSERWSLGVDVDGDLNFLNSTDTTPTVTFNDAGNVGIGTTSPQTELEISAAQSPFLRLTSEKNGTHDAGDIYGELQFYTQETFGNAPVVAAKIQSLHTRAGTGHDNSDAGLAFFTSTASSNATATERMRIESATGNVGIGTDSPAQALEIAGSVRIDNGASFTAYEVYRDNILYGKVGGGSNQFTIQASNNKDINIFDDSGNGLTVEDGGNVGIGTTNPDSPLRVSATASSSIPALGAASSHAAIGAGGFGTMFGTRNTGIGYIQQQRFDGTATAYSLALQPNGGNVGIGTASPSTKLEVAGYGKFTNSDNSPRLHITGGRDYFLTTTSNGLFGLYDNTASSYRLAVDTSGRVGIGTTSPSEALEVTGNIQLSGGADRSIIGPDFRSLNIFSNPNSSTEGIKFSTDGGTTTEVFIQDGGNVGIGTSSPSSTLEISKSDQTNGATLSITNSFDGAGWDSGDTVGTINFRADDSSTTQPIRGQIKLFDDTSSATTYPAYNAMSFSTGNLNTLNERIRIDSSGNVGIGVTNPSRKLTISDSSQYAMNTLNPTSTAGNKSGIAFHGLNSQSLTQFYAGISANFDNTAGGSQSGSLIFETINGNSIAERMRINSSGNLLVGTTDSSVWNNGAGGNTGTVIESDGSIQLAKSNNVTAYLNRLNSDGDIVSFRKDGSTVGNIGTSTTDLFIGTGVAGLRFREAGPQLMPWNTTTNAANDSAIDIGKSDAKFKDLHLSGTISSGAITVTGSAGTLASFTNASDADLLIKAQSGITTLTPTTGTLAFGTSSTERMRIDSSGNLLVGKTSSSTGVAGARFSANGFSNVTRDGGECINFNRLTSDGTIIDFRRDSITVGNIGCPDDANGSQLVIAAGAGGTNTGVGLRFVSFTVQNIIPCYDDGSSADNHIDLGNSGARFEDIYATNGTIQTSDRNDKQDIQALTDAETRVATACKGLLRRFRWQDAVTEKGDEARYHFGIISQDLQSAFTAEGLDAGDYGMFISQTWEDSEGVEQTRLGVRYSELLAFIIAAI